MTRATRLVLAAVLALTAGLALPAVAAGDPAFTVARAALDAAVRCPTGVLSRPVLLVHGTGSTAEESWAPGYLQALPAAGFSACTVTLPNRSTGDAQVSGQYVAYAINKVSRQARGADLAVIGWSQGAVNARWAITFWPSARDKVSDLVSLAGTHHGTLDANVLCAAPCAASVQQQRPGSLHLTALNRRGEALPGVPTTAIYSITDQINTPQVMAPTSALAGASNIAVQDICPGRIVDHAGMLYDAVVWAAVHDALTHVGPAARSRIPLNTCLRIAAPTIDPAEVAQLAGPTLARAALAVATATKTSQEPAVAAYAR